MIKIKKVSKSTFEIFKDNKSLGTVDKYDLERLFNSQVGTAFIRY